MTHTGPTLPLIADELERLATQLIFTDKKLIDNLERLIRRVRYLEYEVDPARSDTL